MEKADSHKMFFKSYPMIKLYKEDIEELTDLFMKNFNKIKIEANEYLLKDISEINNLNKDEIYDFSLSGYDEDSPFYRIWLNITKRTINLYLMDRENIHYLGIVSKIDNIIEKRIRLSNIVNSRWIIYAFLFIFITFSYLINKFIKINDKFSIAIIVPLLFILLLYLLDKMICYNIIFLKYYKDSPDFFKRNRDNIIVGIICAIIGTVIGGLLIYIITK